MNTTSYLKSKRVKADLTVHANLSGIGFLYCKFPSATGIRHVPAASENKSVNKLYILKLNVKNNSLYCALFGLRHGA